MRELTGHLFSNVNADKLGTGIKVITREVRMEGNRTQAKHLFSVMSYIYLPAGYDLLQLESTSPAFRFQLVRHEIQQTPLLHQHSRWDLCIQYCRMLKSYSSLPNGEIGLYPSRSQCAGAKSRPSRMTASLFEDATRPSYPHRRRSNERLQD